MQKPKNGKNQMTELIAKQVVKNKFWIVESNGKKIATIQAIEDGGVAYVHDDRREMFPSIKMLSKKYNIELAKPDRAGKSDKGSTIYEIHGFPTPHKPHNILYDLHKQLPIFTKTAKSKSYFCAGYYIIKFNQHWAKAYCPKSITLNRYEYQGPYRTLEEMQEHLRKANG
jgi:hypothetical protein